MNNRVKRLRDESLLATPRICMERALLETEAYRELEGSTSMPELRALAFYRYMDKRTLYLGEGELIVGEKASEPQAAPTFPELCCHTLEDMRIMDARELISFSVTDDALAAQEKEIIPYWEKRSMRKKLLAAMSDEWKEAYAAGLFTEFMEQRGPGHTVGSKKDIRKGLPRLSEGYRRSDREA